MNLHSVLALLLVLVSLSYAAADRLTMDAGAPRITQRDEVQRDEVVTDSPGGVTDADETAGIQGYWSAWAEAATH
jgi:hypothetical protein